MLKQDESDKTGGYLDQRSEAECDPYGHSCGARQTERPENQDLSPFLDTKRSGNGEGDKGDQRGERRDAESSYRIETERQPSHHQQYLDSSAAQGAQMRSHGANQIACPGTVEVTQVSIDVMRRRLDKRQPTIRNSQASQNSDRTGAD